MYVRINDNGEAERYTLGQLRRENPNVSFPSNISNEMLEQYSIYPLADSVVPTYDSLSQTVSEYLEQVDGQWVRKWQINQIDDNTVKYRLIQAIADDRWNKEGIGIIWTDTSNNVWFIDTTQESQSRLTSAKIAVDANLRLDNGVWKCKKVTIDDEGGTRNVLSFRPTTNAEISVWAKLVHDHVQKCFEAEANAVAKVNAGDFTATFETEFSLL